MEAHYGLLQTNFYPKPAYIAYAQTTGFGSQWLSLIVTADDQGKTTVSIPSTFITEGGPYVIFAQLEKHVLATVAFYQASIDSDGVGK